MLKNKKYNFNSETLSFEIEEKKAGRKFLHSFLRFLAINLAAISILFILLLFFDSPQEKIQEARIDKYHLKYKSISHKVDSLTALVHSDYYSNDQRYRDILELDSIPKNMRLAGFGGHDPYASNFKNYSNKGFSNLMSRMDNLKLQLGVQEKSYTEILNAALEKKDQIQHFPGIPPVELKKNIWISSFFGQRIDPFTRHRKMHEGLDFVGPKNTEIFATADGTVTLTRHSRIGYGNEILVDHKFGYSTRYAHLSEIFVKEGEKVKRGQLIGSMGSTGRSTGVHLHYEVRYHNRPLNPLYFFSDDISPKEFEQLAKRTE